MRLTLLTLLLISFKFNFAQHTEHDNHYHRIASTGFSGTGANIDIKYHKLSWRINPDTTLKYIKGFVQTNFLTTENNVSTVTFDLNDVLTVDSILFRGSRLPNGNISRSGNIISIGLGTTLPLNTLDSIWIYYQGTPPNFGLAGYARVNSPQAGNYITTLSESFEDRDWWPCKADMQDKIDSLDIIVNVPWASPAAADTFWVASNGVLKDSTISGGNRTFVYQTRYPIASYLVCVSVARFKRYYRAPVNISGTNVPIVYYLLEGKDPSTYTNILTAFDKINLVLPQFSTKFSDYPFKLEKHGFYDGLVGAGGMEHQTFSAINSGSLQNIRILTHELLHQWFGDNVTFGTWNDLWLAEGFARYSESYVAELNPAFGLNPFSIINSFKTSALNSTVSAWIPDANIVSSTAIWSSPYGSAVYERGAMIVSMLRRMVGDQKFFEAAIEYQTELSGKTASGDTLKRYFSEVAGQDLTPFFNDYVGGSGNAATPVGGVGHPVYNIHWSKPSANMLRVSIGSQTQKPGSNVSYFRGPVVIHVRGSVPAQDTTITFFDWGSGNLSYAGNGISAPQPGNQLLYNLSFTPLTVSYDDSSRTLSTGVTTELINVPVEVISFTGVKQPGGNLLKLGIETNETIQKVELYKSDDSIDFNLVNEMQNVVSATQVKRYELLDVQPYTSTFYRAKIYMPGREEFTGIINVSAQVNDLTISPNPASEQVSVRFSNPMQETFTFRLLAADGKLARSVRSSATEASLNVRTLSPGIYILQQLRNKKVVATERLVILR